MYIPAALYSFVHLNLIKMMSAKQFDDTKGLSMIYVPQGTCNLSGTHVKCKPDFAVMCYYITTMILNGK